MVTRTLRLYSGRGSSTEEKENVVVLQWSGIETRILRDAMRMSIREFAAHLGVHERLVSKWEAGGPRVHPRPVNQAALDTCFARSDDLVQARFFALLGSATGTPRTGGLGNVSEKDVIMAAAHEASDHAQQAEISNVGTCTLEQLDADVARIAREYVYVPPMPMMLDMVRVRRRVYRLLEGQQRPADTSHLYLLAGTLSGLLANASTDLGYVDAAAEQIRAGWAYAELCGHNGLRAWTRGMHALIEYQSNRPRHAIGLVHHGQQYAESATARVRLAHIEARIWAAMGEHAATHRCVAAATDAGRSDVVDSLHDEVGGVFGFPAAKAAYYAGATYIHLGAAEPALAATHQAIELYASGPAGQRSYGAEALARVDSAVAQVIHDSVEGAAAALAPVLSLPEDKRIAQLADRLAGVQRRIAHPRFRGATEAVRLAERIEEFRGATVARGLPRDGTME